jgi:hypothetical protein
VARRKAKEEEINAKFSMEKNRILEAFRDFKKIDRKMPEGLSLLDLPEFNNDILRHYLESHLVEYTENFDRSTSKTFISIRFKEITPKLILDFWEKSVLEELERKRKNEIVKLY